MSKRKASDSSSKKLVQQKLTGIFTSTKRDKAVTEKDNPQKKFKQETSEREEQPNIAINETVVPHEDYTSTSVIQKSHVSNRRGILDESEDETFEDQDDVEALVVENNTVSREALDVKSEPEELPRDRIGIQPKLTFHDEHYRQVDKLLHAFDLNYRFGPCIGLTRLERWERAHQLGLNPPEEVKHALTSDAITINPELSECVFYGRI